MKFLFYLIIQLFSSYAIAQNPIGILCTNFLVNDEISDEGSTYRKSLESVLSNLKFPPMIIDREKIPDLITKIQEEINLNKDISGKYINDLKVAQVDYIMYGNFDKKLTNKTYDLQLECEKVSGENAFSKKAFPILSFTEKDLRNTDNFRKKLSVMLSNYAFSEEFGILENEQLSRIYKKFDEKDIQIKFLLNNDSLKNIKISKLQNDIVAVRDYVNIAKLNLLGVEQEDGDLIYNSELKIIMKKVFNYDLGTRKYRIINSDSSLLNAELAIKLSPKFPFAYWVKAFILSNKKDPSWIKFSKKAIEILEITTTIDGHNPVHDRILESLKKDTP
jgi:hypothetical protein